MNFHFSVALLDKVIYTVEIIYHHINIYAIFQHKYFMFFCDVILEHQIDDRIDDQIT